MTKFQKISKNIQAWIALLVAHSSVWYHGGCWFKSQQGRGFFYKKSEFEYWLKRCPFWYMMWRYPLMTRDISLLIQDTRGSINDGAATLRHVWRSRQEEGPPHVSTTPWQPTIYDNWNVDHRRWFKDVSSLEGTILKQSFRKCPMHSSIRVSDLENACMVVSLITFTFVQGEKK